MLSRRFDINSLERSLALLLACLQMGCATESEWIQIFNGRDLDGWQGKITGHELGESVVTHTEIKLPRLGRR